jgi:hypothetical protein
VSHEVGREQARPETNQRLDAPAPRPDHHRLVDDAPAGPDGSTAAEGLRLLEREQPPMPVARRLEGQPVLAAATAPAQRRPSIVQLELIRKRDHDVAPCHAAQLIERGVDPVGVLEHVEGDDDIGRAIHHGDAVVEIRDHVRRRMDVQADVANGMIVQGLPERLVPASGVEHRSSPDLGVGGDDGRRLREGTAAIDCERSHSSTRAGRRCHHASS